MFPGTFVVLDVFFKADNALRIDNSFDMRYSQAAILIIAYEC